MATTNNNTAKSLDNNHHPNNNMDHHGGVTTKSLYDDDDDNFDKNKRDSIAVDDSKGYFDTSMTVIEPLEICETNNDNNNNKEKKPRDNCCRLCVRNFCKFSGVMLVLAIANTFAGLLIMLMGTLFDLLLEHAGTITYRDNHGNMNRNGHTIYTRSIEIAIILICQFLVILINFGTLYALCRTFNSSGRDYKAAVAAFCCSCCAKRNKVYPEATRPISEIVYDMYVNAPILHVNCYTIFKLIVWIGFCIWWANTAYTWSQDRLFAICMSTSVVLLSSMAFLILRKVQMDPDQWEVQENKEDTNSSATTMASDETNRSLSVKNDPSDGNGPALQIV